MKKNTFILFFFLFALLPNTIKTQNYFPFPSDSATWYVLKVRGEMIPPYISYYTYKYGVIGDTNINGITYHKIYGLKDSDSLYRSYQGAYRVVPDSSLVYFFYMEDSDECLLYDYTLVPNDTIMIRGFQYVCVDTGSVVLNNNISHKIQYMYVPGIDCMQKWVNGIGSLGIPFWEPYWGCSMSIDDVFFMTCFSYKNEMIYEWDSNPYFTGCVGNLFIGIEENLAERLQVVPNPVQDASKLKGFPNNQQKISYQVLDYSGRTILQQSNVHYSDIEIKKNKFKAGIYFLKINFENLKKSEVVKFLILN